MAAGLSSTGIRDYGNQITPPKDIFRMSTESSLAGVQDGIYSTSGSSLYIQSDFNNWSTGGTAKEISIDTMIFG
jgi:hypothetical protein